MTLFGPLSRALALAGLLLSAPMAVTPALAGPAEVALLQSYIGEWRGRGTLTGANSETVVCRLELRSGNQGRVNYSGRCTLAGTTLAVNGTLAYVEAARRYEAVMTSNTPFSGVAVGQRRGDGIVFNLRERETSEDQLMTISSQIALAGGAISVNFQVDNETSGQRIVASVPFSK